jgi:hypothetical protein
MGMIMTRGHSRVPIYSGSPSNIIGLILVSELNWFLLLNNIKRCAALFVVLFSPGESLMK